MNNDLNSIKTNFVQSLEKVKSEKDLEALRVNYLGKKGEITQIMQNIKNLPKEEKPIVGKEANQLRSFIDSELKEARNKLEQDRINSNLEKEKIDVTLPGKDQNVGGLHPLNKVINELEDIFLGMGFTIEDGPEIEWTKYNFDYLNMPPEHSSRDLSESFYYSTDEGKEIVLRTQTSPVQIRVLQKKGVPLRIVSPGRVFRADDIDATHSPVFHQIEGLVVDKNITMGDLKGTLELFAKKLFGEDIKTRFRPHQFYFTEPSAEMDVSCFNCGGKGCNVCGGTGWIEMLGCGMVHPNVLEAVGIDSSEYSGFAFGAGLDRIAMLKYGINDLRLLFENDIRFLKQFA